MQKQISMTITAEGLRIDLLETKRGLFFDTGNPKPTEAGGELLKVLAAELVKLPNKIAIEGHTDSTPYGRSDYSNWELSADRANAARRILTESGLGRQPHQPGARIRRSAAAVEERPHQSIQPPHLDHRAESGSGRAGRKDGGCSGGCASSEACNHREGIRCDVAAYRARQEVTLANRIRTSVHTPDRSPVVYFCLKFNLRRRST